jgi:hypothetical protein
MGTVGTFAFVVLLSLVVILSIKVVEDSKRFVGEKEDTRDLFQQAARLAMESKYQAHPLLSYRKAMESSCLTDSLIARYGNLEYAERNLKLESGSLQNLKTNIDKRVASIEQAFMNQILVYDESLQEDAEMHRYAGLYV